MGGINHQLRVIMVHNPRCGGTAMQLALGLDHIHDTQKEAKARHGDAWDDYFTFAFVRSPLERLISSYEFARMERSFYHDNLDPGSPGSHGDVHPDYQTVKDKTLDECVKMLLDNPRSLKHPGWRPQSHFISDPADIDFIGKLEAIEEDWPRVCRGIGIDFDLSQVNQTNDESRARFYTPFVCAAVERLYLADFAAFGYRLPLPLLSESEAAAIPDPLPATAISESQGHPPPPPRAGCCGGTPAVPPPGPVQIIETQGGIVGPPMIRL
jgi:hypothetical protein